MWLLIQSKDSPVSVLSEVELSDLLHDPEGSFSVTTFVSEEYLRTNPDPQYWPEDFAALIKAEVVLPVPVTVAWRLPSDA